MKKYFLLRMGRALFSFLLLSLTLLSCHSTVGAGKSKGMGKFKRGDCFDKLLSPYVYQIVQVDRGNIYYYALGTSEKKVKSSLEKELFEGEDSFKKIDCP